MAEESNKRRTRKLKSAPQTVRQQAEKAASAAPKQRRLKKTAKTAARPLHAARRIGAKEYYLPMPDNRLGRFLNKRRSAIPGYFKESWRELRQVTWPDKRETAKLTIAVFAFAIIFGIMIALVDKGLDIVFKALILK